jgi:hypothetical protein
MDKEQFKAKRKEQLRDVIHTLRNILITVKVFNTDENQWDYCTDAELSDLAAVAATIAEDINDIVHQKVAVE